MFNMNLFLYCEKYIFYIIVLDKYFLVRILKFDFGKGVDNLWVIYL